MASYQKYDKATKGNKEKSLREIMKATLHFKKEWGYANNSQARMPRQETKKNS